MTAEKKRLIISLAFPVICLVALAVFKGIKVHSGRTIVLPILGYDPRDILKGHYLTYTVDYGRGNICRGQGEERDIYLCLGEKEGETRIISGPREQYARGCRGIIKGRCGKDERFHAGIEKFFIPENRALELDKLVRGKKGSLVLKVDQDGNAVISDLLIEGTPWKDYMNK